VTVVELNGGEFDRLVIEVGDPAAQVDRLRTALAVGTI
jgi:hypothetical protein